MMALDKIDEMVAQYPHIWKTRASVFSWIKGIIRKGWNRAPQKITLINKMRKQIPNPNPKGKKPTVWGATCEICLNDYALKDMQCDHRDEATAHLTQIEHIQPCAEKLLLVVEEDLRLICKGCHNLHSIAQLKGVSFEEAKVEKLVIEFSKNNAEKQKHILTNTCNLSIMPPNAKARAEAYRNYLKEK